MLHIEERIQSLPEERRRRLERIYRLEHLTGRLILTPTMHDWVVETFGRPELVETQHIIKVTNVVTWEGSIFNSLRLKRPLSREESDVRIQELLGRGYDPFCNGRSATPADTFGRIEGEHCYTASNIAKYDGHHAVVVFKEHNPLSFTAEQIADYFDVGGRWAEAAHAEDPAARYYLFIWNCLPRAGASVVHGHAQVTLTGGSPYPKVEALWRAAAGYRERHGSGYFDDLTAVHADLGLGFAWRGVHVCAHLTPIKERELLLVGSIPDRSRPARLSPAFKGAIHRALMALVEGMGVTAFNLVLYLPPLAGDGNWAGFPAVVRMVDRGEAQTRTADFGTMELYAASVVSSDPFAVADTLKRFFADEE